MFIDESQAMKHLVPTNVHVTLALNNETLKYMKSPKMPSVFKTARLASADDAQTVYVYTYLNRSHHNTDEHDLFTTKNIKIFGGKITQEDQTLINSKFNEPSDRPVIY